MLTFESCILTGWALLREPLQTRVLHLTGATRNKVLVSTSHKQLFRVSIDVSGEGGAAHGECEARVRGARDGPRIDLRTRGPWRPGGTVEVEVRAMDRTGRPLGGDVLLNLGRENSLPDPNAPNDDPYDYDDWRLIPDPPPARYQHRLTLGGNGRATVRLELPEEAAELALEAVAITDQGAGMARHWATAALGQKVAVEVDIPHFLTQGDTIEIPIRLSNPSPQKRTFHFRPRVLEQLVMTGGNDQLLTLAPGETHREIVKLNAKHTGKAILAVGGQKFALEIREPVAELSDVTDGELGPGEVTEPVHPGPGSLLVKLSSLPFLEFFHDPETASDLVRLLQSQRVAILRGDAKRAAELQPRIDEQLAKDRPRWQHPEGLESFDLIAAAEGLIATKQADQAPILKALRDHQTADPALQARLLSLRQQLGDNVSQEAQELLERGAGDLNPLLFEPWLAHNDSVWQGLLNRLELTADGAQLVDETLSRRYRDEDKLLAELIRRTPDSPLIPLMARGSGGAFALLPTLDGRPAQVRVNGTALSLKPSDPVGLDLPLAGPVTITNQGPGQVFYQLVRRGPRDIPEGTTVTRTYVGPDVRRDPDGTWHIPYGATVKVVLRSDRRGVFTDSLPAGLDPVTSANPYLTRARYRGRFYAPPALLKVDGSRVEGQSRSDTIIVE